MDKIRAIGIGSIGPLDCWRGVILSPPNAQFRAGKGLKNLAYVALSSASAEVRSWTVSLYSESLALQGGEEVSRKGWKRR